MIDYRELAKKVLKLAGALDARMAMPASRDDQIDRVDAWGSALKGRVWPSEAEDAVIEHYRERRSILLPGDVVDYCKRQPVWSSVEHARDWIYRIGLQEPYSGAIEAYSGMQEPRIEIPAEIAREAHKDWLVMKLTEWAVPRIDELAAAIVARKYVPWWIEERR